MGKANNGFISSPWDDFKYQDDSMSMRSSTVAASEIVARRVRKFEEEMATTSASSPATSITLQINVLQNYENAKQPPATDVKGRAPPKPERLNKPAKSNNKVHGESRCARENSVQSGFTKKVERDGTQEATNRKFYYSKREVSRTQRFRRKVPVEKFKRKRRLVYALLSTLIALCVIIGIWITISIRFNQTDDWHDAPEATTTTQPGGTTTTDLNTEPPLISTTELPTTVTLEVTVPPSLTTTTSEGPDGTTTGIPTPGTEKPPTTTTEIIATTDSSTVTSEPDSTSSTTPPAEAPITSDLPINIAFACTFVISFVVIYMWIAIYVKHKEETFIQGDSKSANASNQTSVATILSNEMYYISDLPSKLNSII